MYPDLEWKKERGGDRCDIFLTGSFSLYMTLMSSIVIRGQHHICSHITYHTSSIAAQPKSAILDRTVFFQAKEVCWT